MVFLSLEQPVSVAFVITSQSSTQNFQPTPIFFLQCLLALLQQSVIKYGLTILIKIPHIGDCLSET